MDGDAPSHTPPPEGKQKKPRNRGARLARMLKIEREYAMGDLRATYRGRQTSSLRGATRPALRDTATSPRPALRDTATPHAVL